MMMVNVCLSIRIENFDLGSFLCCQNLHKQRRLTIFSNNHMIFANTRFFQQHQTDYDKLHMSIKHSLIFLSNVNRSNEFMFCLTKLSHNEIMYEKIFSK